MLVFQTHLPDFSLPGMPGQIYTGNTLLPTPGAEQQILQAAKSASLISSMLPGTLSSSLSFYTPINPWQTRKQLKALPPRWPKEKRILSVGYSPLMDKKETILFVQLLMLACQQWQQGTQHRFVFSVEQMQVSDLKQTEHYDIVLDWTEEVTIGREYEVGHAKRRLKDRWIQQVAIMLLTHTAIDNTLSPVQQQNRLYATLLHELGHALGLEHAMESTAVMFHRGWQQTRLTVADLRQFGMLYPEPVQTSFLF
jgi:hypothetical protein